MVFGNGIKKPMNLLVGPVFPDIKRAPPRFVWSRKHWNVDVGATLRDTEPITQFYEPAILAQSRNYNQTTYGVSSHRDTVNAAFRPPLLSPYEDIGPITRIPATIHAIIPHINPGTAGHGSGTSGYTAKNERINNIESALTDRIKAGEWRPTFYCPIEIPQDNSVLPDLELKMPNTSAHAGWEIPIRLSAPIQEVSLNYEKLHPSGEAGYNTPVTLSGPTGKENLELHSNRPSISAHSGMNTPVHLDAEVRTSDLELFSNRPNISVTAGINTPLQIDSETRVEDLLYNRPQVSVDAGRNMPLQIDSRSAIENIELETQIDAPLTVTNPGAEDGYKTRLEMQHDEDNYIQSGNPAYSYVVPSTPTYRETNERTHKPHFKERLAPLKHYGQITHSSSIPRNGIDQKRVSLRTLRRMATEPRKAKYRF